MRQKFLYRFTVVQRNSLQELPPVYVHAASQRLAVKYYEELFPKSQFDMKSMTTVTSNLCVVAAFDNYEPLITHNNE